MDMYGYISAIALFIYAGIFLVVLASAKHGSCGPFCGWW